MSNSVVVWKPMRGAATINVALTPQLEELVKKKVGSGLYGSASEVMRAALRLEESTAEIKQGIESGEPTPLDIRVIKAWPEGRKLPLAQAGAAGQRL